MVLNQTDLNNWIDLLYNNLLQKDILIGGYLFNVFQIPEMEKTLQKFYVKQKVKNVYGDITRMLRSILFNQKNINTNLPEILTIRVKKKDGTKTHFPVMIEEYMEVLSQLKDKLNAINHFRLFCKNELQFVSNPDEFSVFVNDLYDETNKELDR